MSKNTFFPKKVSFLFFAISAETPIFIVFSALHCFGPKKNLAKTDSCKCAFFVSLPDTNSVRQFLLKIHFFDFSHFCMTTLKKPYFYRVFCYFPLFVFFLFSVSLFQHKKEKTKNAIYFSKTSFFITQNFAKTLFWHTVTLFVLQKKPKKHYKTGEKTAKKNLDQFLTYNLDQFLTYKTPNLGPVFNFTAYIYIYIYCHRPICGPHFCRKCHFPQFYSKKRPKQRDSEFTVPFLGLTKTGTISAEIMHLTKKTLQK